MVLINTILIVLFVIINIGLARYDAHRIKKNLRIRHAINSIVYIGLLLVFWKVLTPTKIVGLLLIRIPVFNTALNLYRGLPAHHLSKTTTSIIDQAVNRYVAKVGHWPYCIFLTLLSLILIYI